MTLKESPHPLGDCGSGDAWPRLALPQGAQVCLQKWNELNSALSSAVTGKMMEDGGKRGEEAVEDGSHSDSKISYYIYIIFSSKKISKNRTIDNDFHHSKRSHHSISFLYAVGSLRWCSTKGDRKSFAIICHYFTKMFLFYLLGDSSLCIFSDAKAPTKKRRRQGPSMSILWFSWRPTWESSQNSRTFQVSILW